MIWLAPYVEHKTTVGGKGGPQQQTFNYTQSIAIALCERVDDEADDRIGAIAGVTRIWENGAIVFDIRPQMSANTLLNTLAETDLEYANRLTASAAYAARFTLYLGDELQLPDPTIEAVEGFGNVPAFRGLAYIVFPNRALSLAQGLRHPNFQFEVYQSGIGDCVLATLYSTNVLYPWAGGTEHNPVEPRNVNTFQLITADNNYGVIGFQPTYPSEDDMLAVLRAFGYTANVRYIGYSSGVSGSNEITQAGCPPVTTWPAPGPDPQSITLHFNNVLADSYWSAAQFAAGLAYGAETTPGAFVHLGVDSRVYFNTGSSAGIAPALDSPTFTQVVGAAGGYWYQTVQDATVAVVRYPAPPPAPCYGLPPSINVPGYAVMGDGRLIECSDWTVVTGGAKVLQIFQALPNCIYPLNPCLPTGDPNYSNAAFWTAAYVAAVAAGKMASGKVYGVDYPVVVTSYYTVQEKICSGAGSGVTLAQIIAAVCKRAGLSAIDVTDMEAVTVAGYAVATVCSGSAIISPLRSIGFFDAVESEGTLKFLARGKPIVATFTTDDFGAYDASQSTNPATCPPSVTTARQQDVELPRSIRFHYMATSRDYQDAEQDSEFRLSTDATNDVDVTVPVCLDDTQAKRCAEVLWAAAWASRSSHNLAVDQAWLGLDLGDCIGVPIDGVIQRLRLVSDTIASGVLRKLSCVRDGQGAYISFAVAEAPAHVPAKLLFIPPSSAEYLDLPCLQDADSDPGFYVAVQRQAGLGNGWQGATVYKSTDAGATFSQLFSLLTEATIGSLTAAVPASQALTWDDVTVIEVTVAAAFSFASVTDDAMLAGANAAAMGADRRWEIVQFGHATQVDATHWHLSHLLRGRRGTEYVMGTSQVGDAFVLISGGDLGRVVLTSSEIGTDRIYKVVSINTEYGTGIDTSFAGHAQALVPFSPVDVSATHQSNDDILITWLRRSRLGRTLMSGVDIPLGETTEAFQIDILDPGSPATVLRTLTTAIDSVLYTHTQQVADFGLALPLLELDVAIYQMSSVVGRGTPARATLTLPPPTTIAVRQQKTQEIDLGSILDYTVNFDTPVLPGSIIHVFTAAPSMSSGFLSPVGASWHAIGVTANHCAHFWMVALGGETSVTVQEGTGALTPADINIVIREIVGAAHTAPVAHAEPNVLNSAGVVDYISSGLMNNTAGPALISAWCSDNSLATAAAGGTGLTVDSTGTTGLFVTTEHKRITALGNVAATFTSPAGSIYFTMAAIFAEGS